MINLNEMKRDYIGREPRDYIVESVTVPEGLEEKVLAAMTQKRKEIEEIQHEKLSLRQEKQEKKAAHKSVAIRAAVIAAVITLMILIIPSSRQVVVSAAEKVFGWLTSVFSVEVSDSDNGCTIEVIDAKLGNDFIYMTITEDFTALYENNPTLGGSILKEDGVTLYKSNYEDNDNGRYVYRYIPYYYGKISDNQGNYANFVSGNDVLYRTYDGIDEDNIIMLKGGQSEYSFFCPDINKVVTSDKKKYSCELHAKIYCIPQYDLGVYYHNFHEVIQPDEDDLFHGEKPAATFDLSFPIKNIDYVLNAKKYQKQINQTITFDGFTMIFKKAFQLDRYSQNLLIELNSPKDCDIGKSVCAINVYASIKENKNDDAEDKYWKYQSANLYYINSRYYALLSDESEEKNLDHANYLRFISAELWEAKGSYHHDKIAFHTSSSIWIPDDFENPVYSFEKLSSTTLCPKKKDFGIKDGLKFGDYKMYLGKYSLNTEHNDWFSFDHFSYIIDSRFIRNKTDDSNEIVDSDFSVVVNAKRSGYEDETISFGGLRYSHDGSRPQSADIADDGFSSYSINSQIKDYDEWEIKLITYAEFIHEGYDENKQEYINGKYIIHYCYNPSYYSESDIQHLIKETEGKNDLYFDLIG